ncbi:MAG TPA: amidohydrolase family protein [Xanthobacteraceae bacterium]|jgi:cytosine/adenosine deaminase-related metal-dependent hydrolase
MHLTRRRFIGDATALAAAGLSARRVGAADLPSRGEFIVRGAHVLTMDPALGDIARGDIHVRDGEIVAVGTDLSAPGSPTIDARAMIALPGLIDTHNHLWNSTLRSLVREGPEKGYFPTVLALGKEYAPQDTYRGVRLGCAELIYSGVTTVHDWAHNIRSPAHADADVRALIDTGIRGRFSYGTYQGGPAPDETMDIADLRRMHRNWADYASEGRLALGMASRSVSTSPRGSVTLPALHRDWEAARSLALPITIHTGGKGIVEILEREGLLARDVQLINTTAWDEADRARIAKAGAHVSITPHSEMRYSYGLPRALELLRLGLKVSLAMDTAPVAGSNDLFSAMRLMMDTQFVRSRDPLSISARQVLEMATINGAWDLGIADRVGSLTPGKRADLILVRANDLNMAPLGDPVTAIVRSAQPHNVDTVVVDGRVLKRDGRLTALDPDEIVAEAAESLAGLRERAHWS